MGPETVLSPEEFRSLAIDPLTPEPESSSPTGTVMPSESASEAPSLTWIVCDEVPAALLLDSCR